MIADLTPYTVDANTGILHPEVDTLMIYPIHTRHMAAAFRSIRLRDADVDAGATTTDEHVVVEDLDVIQTTTDYPPHHPLMTGDVEDYYAALKKIQRRHSTNCDAITDVCVNVLCDPTKVSNDDPTYTLFPLVVALFVVCADLEADGPIGAMPGIIVRVDASHERDLQTLTTVCMTGSPHTNARQLLRLRSLYRGQAVYE